MSREQERLDRLMGLLASESSDRRDLRGSVMARLARGGAFIRRARWMRRTALAVAIVAGAWVGLDAWRASSMGTDLGGVARRGMEWIAPETRTVRVVPVRSPARPRDEDRIVVAPWGNT